MVFRIFIWLLWHNRGNKKLLLNVMSQLRVLSIKTVLKLRRPLTFNLQLHFHRNVSFETNANENYSLLFNHVFLVFCFWKCFQITYFLLFWYSDCTAAKGSKYQKKRQKSAAFYEAWEIHTLFIAAIFAQLCYISP